MPTEPVSVAVALADKLDMLVGFWAIDEKPTGSKDPYALRRAALGVIRIVLENDCGCVLRRSTSTATARLTELVRDSAARDATDACREASSFDAHLRVASTCSPSSPIA